MRVEGEVTLDSLRLEPLRNDYVYGKGIECDDGIIPCAAARTESLGAAAETMDRVSSSSKYQEEATKAYLGGYQDRETKCSYFNASTQFGYPLSQVRCCIWYHHDMVMQ